MSRVGSAVITVASGVDVKTQSDEVHVKGTHGQLSVRVPEGISVAYDTAKREIAVSRADDRRELRALHGLVRALIANHVRGVVQPWEKKLEIVGVGYEHCRVVYFFPWFLSCGLLSLVVIPSVCSCHCAAGLRRRYDGITR